ncbi:GNAT family N-acetyltransferase [Sinirhodobacter populi]|nr:GNAT family N-acetyltransferase [Sinirhodobacter populi]
MTSRNGRALRAPRQKQCEIGVIDAMLCLPDEGCCASSRRRIGEHQARDCKGSNWSMLAQTRPDMPVPLARIRRGVPEADRRAAAELYWQAFGAKLGPVMGPRERALAFIERVMDSDHVLSAWDGSGRLLGVIGFRSSHGAFVGGTTEDLDAVYGPFGGLWRKLALSVLGTDLPGGVLAVDGLVVVDDARGTGIGAALIEALSREARDRGYRSLQLEVVDGNDRARALYERLGFLHAGWSRSFLAALFFGIRGSTSMQRPL